MTSEFLHHEPCPECGSQDNLARFSDGHAWCFGCGHYEPGGEGDEDYTSERAEKRRGPLLRGHAQALSKRALTEETCQKFRYMVGRLENGEPVQIANYCDKAGRVVAQKYRPRDKNKIRWVGDPKAAVPLFGWQLWSSGGKRIIVTEGEIDALSMSQAQNNRWPVVSIPNGAQGAKRDLKNEFVWNYLESFDAIVLMFDQDEAGQEAVAACAELFSPGKVHIASLPLKDPNEMLKAGRADDLRACAWEARAFRPDGVIEGVDLWDAVRVPPERGIDYPWPTLSQVLYGQRKRSVVVWCAGTGIGKSQIVKEIAFHLATTHSKRVGIVSLEESVRHAALCQLSLAINKPLHLPDVREAVSDTELRKAFDVTLGTGRYIFYDHFGSVEADVLLPKIRFMAVSGCEYIILDHISIAISGMATEGDERKRIDELMTNLRSLVEKEEVGLHVVSHLRKTQGKPFEEGGQVSLVDLRGSGAIGQIADVAVAAERDQQSKDMKHHTHLRVLKDRYSGFSGLAGTLVYSQETGRMTETNSFEAALSASQLETDEDF